MENEKLETVVSQHSIEIAKLQEQYKGHDKDIVKLQDSTEAINRLATSVELLAQQGSTTNEKIEKLDIKLNDKIDKVDSKVNKMDDTVEEIKSQPDKKDAEKWNGTIKQVMTIIISVVIGIALAKIGLKL